MFPKITLQTDTNFLHVVTCMQNFAHETLRMCSAVKHYVRFWCEDVKRNLPIVGVLDPTTSCYLSAEIYGCKGLEKPFCRFAAWIANSESHIKRIPVKVSFVVNTLRMWLIVKYALPRPLRLGIEPIAIWLLNPTWSVTRRLILRVRVDLIISVSLVLSPGSSLPVSRLLLMVSIPLSWWITSVHDLFVPPLYKIIVRLFPVGICWFMVSGLSGSIPTCLL